MGTMSAADRREVESASYEDSLRVCPTRQVVDLISSRWVSLVVCALGEDELESLRYNELRRRLPSVSQKMLTQTVRALERDGIVERTVTPAVPVQVDYRLTEVGRSFYGMLLGLRTWSEANFGQIQQARSRHDGRSAD